MVDSIAQFQRAAREVATGEADPDKTIDAMADFVRSNMTDALRGFANVTGEYSKGPWTPKEQVELLLQKSIIEAAFAKAEADPDKIKRDPHETEQQKGTPKQWAAMSEAMKEAARNDATLAGMLAPGNKAVANLLEVELKL